jgi:hypothetical protein
VTNGGSERVNIDAPLESPTSPPWAKSCRLGSPRPWRRRDAVVFSSLQSLLHHVNVADSEADAVRPVNRGAFKDVSV